MITCQSCGFPMEVDLSKGLTPDWNYRVQCQYCGQEQFGVVYYGVPYPTPLLLPMGESAKPVGHAPD